VVESQPSKLLVAGSIPVSRSILRSRMQAKDAHYSSRRERRWATREPVSYGWHATLRELVVTDDSGTVSSLADLSAVARVDRAARAKADVAQLAERVLGKDEVTSSILVIGSILRSRMQAKDAHHSSRSERRWATREP
jgi:hypothetical protein